MVSLVPSKERLKFIESMHTKKILLDIARMLGMKKKDDETKEELAKRISSKLRTRRILKAMTEVFATTSLALLVMSGLIANDKYRNKN